MFYILPRYKYYRPTDLGEALELINELENARVLAGGTDLLIDMRIGRYRPEHVIDISGLNELKYIRSDDRYVYIGSLTTLNTILRTDIIKKKAPLLYHAVYNMASWQIRVRATIGGNLCNASPAADTAPPLLVYDAELVLTSVDGDRIVSIHEFFKGPRKTVLKKNELLREIRIPIESNYGYAYRKLGRRNAFTLSVVSVATMVKISDDVYKDVRIALNSIAPTPVRARNVEKYLIGKRIYEQYINEASRLVVNDISPITDIRSTAEYRRKASIILVYDTLLESTKMIGGEVM